jgi:hypothetical protein
LKRPKRPKHERLTELLTDAFWSYANADRSVTDPERMTAVVGVITDLLRSQPRCEDSDGCLQWAADFLDKRLQEDADG